MNRSAAKAERTNGNREVQRRTVLETAARLFSTKGYGGTSMADIAGELGVTRPALYYYFDSKEQILTSLVKEVTLYIRDLGDSAVDEKRDPAEALYDLVLNNALFILRNAVLFRMVERCENDFPRATKIVNERGKRRIFAEFKTVIARGVQSGHFRDVDPTVAAFSVLGLSNWSAWWFNAQGRLSDTAVAAQIAGMAVASVRKGDARLERDKLRSQLESAQAAVSSSMRLLRRL